MNLCIDIGNTRSKLAVFDEEGSLKKLIVREKFSQTKLEKVVGKYEIKHAILSSVRKKNGKLKRFLDTHIESFIDLTVDIELPVTNNYHSPETLGRDRIALVVGASALFPKSDILVIDAGTCITYDFIDAQANYHGGSISMGLDMRFKALNHFTAKLPLVQRRDLDSHIGYTTETSIQTGLQCGVVYEMQGFIAAYRAQYPDLRVLITGGDANFFESRFKNQIFAVPNLVLKGLNQILTHNVQQAKKS
jgi:type III pantothenate kinase